MISIIIMIIILAKELKKTVEHESNDCANFDWCVRHSN